MRYIRLHVVCVRRVCYGQREMSLRWEGRGVCGAHILRFFRKANLLMIGVFGLSL